MHRCCSFLRFPNSWDMLGFSLRKQDTGHSQMAPRLNLVLGCWPPGVLLLSSGCARERYVLLMSSGQILCLLSVCPGLSRPCPGSVRPAGSCRGLSFPPCPELVQALSAALLALCCPLQALSGSAWPQPRRLVPCCPVCRLPWVFLLCLEGFIQALSGYVFV